MMASTELDIALQKVIAVTAPHAHDVRAAVPLVSAPFLSPKLTYHRSLHLTHHKCCQFT